MIREIIPRMSQMMIANFGTEIIYSFMIIACSLMIYFGTKKLYETSSYKGIKYFRQTFLFFALAYFSRTFIKLIALYFDSDDLMRIAPSLMNPLVAYVSMLLFLYFSTTAIFYLMYSIVWKKVNHSNYVIPLIHLISFLLAFIILFFGNLNLYIFVNIILFAAVLYAIYFSTTFSKKSKFYTVYILLALFWILNILDILIPGFLVSSQILVYLASLSIFLLIAYKVLRTAGN